MSADDFSNQKPGEHRCPGPSTRDIILADGGSRPEALITESYAFEGDADIGFERYFSQSWFDREMTHLWPKVWQWACREEHIPHVGDYITYDIGVHSFIVTRVSESEIKAYYNACLHRGTQLRPSGTEGSTAQFRCPFHGWTWNLDGSLKDIPCRWDFPHVKDENYRLPEVKVATWGGFVFINMDPQAGPLQDYLGVLPDHFQSGWDLSNRYTALHIQKELHTNWKAAEEAFFEAYHVLETHAAALPFAADANAQYDVFGENVSRFIHTLAHPSPHYKTPQSPQEMLAKMGIKTEIPEGRSARAVAAEHTRRKRAREWGVDLSGYSDSEMLDSINYHLFPNMCLFPGISLPMVYRFRPIGNDPGKTLFDLLFLRPLAPGAERPEAAEPVFVAEAESYAVVPGLNKGLAAIYDEDTGNLRAQYKGFQTSKKPGQTLGNYQEIRIRHFENTVDKYLKG